MAARAGPNLTKIAKNVFLAEPSQAQRNGSSAPQAIILLGWMDAQLKHLTSYVRGYQKLYPTSSIIIVQSHQSAFYSLSPKIPSEPFKPILPLLAARTDATKPGWESDILVHVFSNGGCMNLQALNELYLKSAARAENEGEESQKALLSSNGTAESTSANEQGVPARCIIFDSCPGKLDLPTTVLALSAPIRNRLIKFPVQAVLAIFYFLWTSVDVILRRPSISERMRKYLASSLPAIPRLFLYSNNDKLVRSIDVQAHIETIKAKGVQVTADNFGDSDHVAHARKDPQRYWTAIEKFWETSGKH